MRALIFLQRTSFYNASADPGVSRYGSCHSARSRRVPRIGYVTSRLCILYGVCTPPWHLLPDDDGVERPRLARYVRHENGRGRGRAAGAGCNGLTRDGGSPRVGAHVSCVGARSALCTATSWLLRAASGCGLALLGYGRVYRYHDDEKHLRCSVQR